MGLTLLEKSIKNAVVEYVNARYPYTREKGYKATLKKTRQNEIYIVFRSPFANSNLLQKSYKFFSKPQKVASAFDAWSYNPQMYYKTIDKTPIYTLPSLSHGKFQTKSEEYLDFMGMTREYMGIYSYKGNKAAARYPVTIEGHKVYHGDPLHYPGVTSIIPEDNFAPVVINSFEHYIRYEAD